MAKTDANGRSGGSSWIPVAVAVVAVGLFFAWMATREPPPTVAVAEPGDTVADTAAPTDPATVIAPDVLQQSATSSELIGQNIELSSVSVAQALGMEMFWINLPNGSPFLVKMDSGQIAGGTSMPAPGSSVRVVGRLLEKTPAVLDEWMTSGLLQDSIQRSLAEFGSTFIAAQRVEPAGS